MCILDHTLCKNTNRKNVGTAAEYQLAFKSMCTYGATHGMAASPFKPNKAQIKCWSMVGTSKNLLVQPSQVTIYRCTMYRVYNDNKATRNNNETSTLGDFHLVRSDAR